MTDRKRKLDIYEAAPAGVTVVPPASQPTVNPYTGRQYSQKYYDILAKRKGEPWGLWQFRDTVAASTFQRGGTCGCQCLSCACKPVDHA